MKHNLERSMIPRFQAQLAEEERSRATIGKYIHDVDVFFSFVQDAPVDKEKVMEYKQYLIEKYAPASVNSMLVALNRFLKAQGWYDCVVKLLKIQKVSFRSREKELSREEYLRLLFAAGEKKDQRLYYLMQTICATGIRVSELRFITAEAVKEGRAKVTLKGKVRTVLLSAPLCRVLKKYMKERNIQKGSLFVTRRGRPLDRSNIWHEMKALCEKAGVSREKVFPHNLRHLFACTYYKKEKDLSHLADLLGHSSIDTTRIYTMVSGEEQSRRIAALGLVV